MHIVLCLPGREFSGKFLQCFHETMDWCRSMNHKVTLRQEYSSNVHFVRARCLACDTRLGRKQPPFQGVIRDYDVIVWIDSDIIWKLEDFKRLLNTNHMIYSGSYLMENGAEFPVVTDWNLETFKKHGTFHFLTVSEMQAHKQPFECVYNGMGFMAVKKGVFEKIDYPWFAPVFTDSPPIYDFCSEDVGFCLRAREQGFKVMVDPEILVGHLKSRVLDVPRPSLVKQYSVWSSVDVVSGMK